MFNLSKQELKDYGFIRSLKINWRKYKKVNQLRPDDEPVVHCVKNGKYNDVYVPGYFSTADYLALNKEAIESDKHPVVHYEEAIRNGGRPKKPSFFSKKVKKVKIAQLKREEIDGVLLSPQELEDFFFFFTAPIPWINFHTEELEKDYIDIIIYVIKSWKTERIIIKGVYDSKVYLENNKDVEQAGLNPLLHFYKYGNQEKRTARENIENRKFEIDIIHSKNVNWDGFFKHNNITLKRQKEAVEYYVDNWRYENLQLEGFFDTGFYLKNYPDIAAVGINPLFHYVTNGMEEGRKGFLDLDEYLDVGDKGFDENLPTIAIVSHESSATGAPLVGLNLGNSLNNKHNIIHFIVRKKQLHPDFLAGSSFTLKGLADNPRFYVKALLEAVISKYPLMAAVCNSVETIEVLDVFSELKVPTVALIHEFSDYTLPKGKISNTVCFADRVVVPAELIKKSIVKEINECFGITAVPNNIVVCPQGYLPFVPALYGENLSDSELREKFSLAIDQTLVVGAGYVQIRKGVDLFISVASYLNKMAPGKYKFVWAGDGYDPDHDLSYSVWLKRQILESNLEDNFFFLKHQRSLGNLLSITDVFLLTSRLDPFPNVVIDALQSGVHVACFENSTGCAEFLANNESSSSVSDYADTAGMAKKIHEYACSGDIVKSQAYILNRRLVKTKLDFEQYSMKILSEIGLAKQIINKRKEHELVIDESGLFDFNYYALLDTHARGLDHYVKCAMKGIHVSNPSPAFHEEVWLQNHQETENLVPLVAAIEQGIESTHCNIILNGSNQEVVLKGAVHLHLYYEDMYPFFIEKFAVLPAHFDLYITVCHKESVSNVEKVFSVCNFNKTQVIYVENIGRDIVPFLSALKKELFSNDDYDVVGHFHSKKSVDNEPGFGDKWLDYLMNNLVGDKANVAQLLSQFEDRNCGIVYAADHHNVGLGENKQFADELCKAMNIEPMKYAANFPLGTMFWARPQALSLLFELDLSPFKQAEPLPYDGSYMHAIERLLPHVARSSGFEITTVYKPGTTW
ncbi:rhamnan synthesis F family protein [Paraglaciecola sp. 25GB23A]|uniref:rhamnan synthesis F family protein n=1 Tax=Paraglaciecola sp. 25GB23A TaxID=3156068 RepID=UPI0032AF2100